MSAQWRLALGLLLLSWLAFWLYLALPCLDSIASVPLLELVLSYLFTVASLILLSVLLSDLLFALLASCILFHFTIANVALYLHLRS